MGTNYYAKIIPSEKQKQALKDAIDQNNFNEIEKMVGAMYHEIHEDYDMNKHVGGIIHLGKRSSGWKFLWNPNFYEVRAGHWDNTTRSWIREKSKCQSFYELTKKGIKSFIDRADVEIYDEYGDKQDKEAFWKMALEWCQEDGWDGDAYEEEEKKKGTTRPCYRTYESEYINFLESNGYIMNRYYTDFYNDGLRFATCTDFS